MSQVGPCRSRPPAGSGRWQVHIPPSLGLTIRRRLHGKPRRPTVDGEKGYIRFMGQLEVENPQSSGYVTLVDPAIQGSGLVMLFPVFVGGDS